MRAWSRAERAQGKRVGFVPTMGFLHEGHLRLVDQARSVTDVVVVSAFVNPLQFGPGEDFARYPRDLERDHALAESRGVAALFVPSAQEMYPVEPLVRVAPGPMAETLEGTARPGHFAGVLTVVAKLLHAVEPDVAVFGRKDYQQVMLVRQMVEDLDFPVRIEVSPTVRELEGLALSSRNSYLSADQRRAALALSRCLREVERCWRSGAADPAAVRRKALEVLSVSGVTPEYLDLVDDRLRPVERVTQTTVALVAARLGPTRLIDNVILGEGVGADPTVHA
jgi:pantoate--beta-alanine ligase